MTSLRSLLSADRKLATRFVSDARTTLSVEALLTVSGNEDWEDEVRGRTVLIAVVGQLPSAAALLNLDGVASRIIVWPHDGVRPQLDALLQTIQVDVVVTEWPVPRAGPGSAPRAIAAKDCSQRTTEWVLFTSGTTGQPKLVVHTLESLSGHLWSQDAGSGGAVWCTFYDIRRYGGLQVFFRAMLQGGSLVVPAVDETPGSFLERAAAARATHFVGTPSHWRRVLMTDAASRISPVYVRLSGEAPDQTILDRLRTTYPHARIVHAFASTEAGLAFEVHDGLAGFPEALVGRSESAAEVCIRNGSLRLRSARNALGYIDGAVRDLAEADGFVDTGDAVVLRSGRYYFTGRRDGIINVGGLKVHPEEVESVINQHPDVQMSMVLGRPNPITGAIVVAKVVPRLGHSDAQERADGSVRRLQDDIRAFCGKRLEAYKVPASVALVDDLNLSPAGKLARLGA